MSLSKERRSSWEYGFVAVRLEDVVGAVVVVPAVDAPALAVAVVAVVGGMGGREDEALLGIDALGFVVREEGIYAILVAARVVSCSNGSIGSPDRRGRCVERQSHRW